jgi:hypothetical protein
MPPKGINNYGLLPVGYKDTDKHWEKTKREIGQDFRKLRENAVIASETAKEGIKKAYDWTGVWLPSALLSGGGLAYVCSQHPGDEYSWLKGVLGGAFVGSLGKLVTRIEKKKEESRENIKIQKEVRDLLEKIVRTPLNGDLKKKNTLFGYKVKLEFLLDEINRSEGLKLDRIEEMRKTEIEPIKDWYGNY